MTRRLPRRAALDFCETYARNAIRYPIYPCSLVDDPTPVRIDVDQRFAEGAHRARGCAWKR